MRHGGLTRLAPWWKRGRDMEKKRKGIVNAARQKTYIYGKVADDRRVVWQPDVAGLVMRGRPLPVPNSDPAAAGRRHALLVDDEGAFDIDLDGAGVGDGGVDLGRVRGGPRASQHGKDIVGAVDVTRQGLLGGPVPSGAAGGRSIGHGCVCGHRALSEERRSQTGARNVQGGLGMSL